MGYSPFKRFPRFSSATPTIERHMHAKARAGKVIDRLRERYPQPEVLLAFASPWELAVAVVLSAQCTDARVNQVTPALFRRFPTVAAMALAAQEEVEELVRSTGFFRNKARNLIAAAKAVVERHAGEVPRSMAELTALPGLGRKSANIVLSKAFGVNEGIAVDTHVKRIAARLGLTESADPIRIEKDLTALLDPADWGAANHLLVLFGREVCSARKPACPACPLLDLCPRQGLAPLP